MAIFDWFFPKRCLGCGSWGSYICPACQAGLRPLSHLSFRKPENLEGLLAVWSYQGLIKQAIKRFKYNFVSDLGHDLAGLALSRIESQRQEFKPFFGMLRQRPIVVPVPLHSSRKHWRGFNQAEIIGRKIAVTWHLAFSNRLILKQASTLPQVSFKKAQRIKNLQGAFVLNRQMANLTLPLKSRHFLIIDDVWTTGATMEEMAKVLKRVGAKSVWGLTLAH